jgi:hypothetical protein
MEANGWAWDEEIKKDLLKAALTSEVSKELAGRDEPKAYAMYVAQIRKITDDLKTRKTSGNLQPVTRTALSGPGTITALSNRGANRLGAYP